MDKLVRTGIVTLAATVALGAAGFAVAGASTVEPDPVVKREDTSTSWVQSTDVDVDDDDLRDDDGDVNTVNTANTLNTKDTKNTVNTKNSAPTANTVKTVNSAPTKNSAPTN